VLGQEEFHPLLRKPQKPGVEAPVMGLEESCPPLRKLQKPGAEALEEEDRVELQRESQEEQLWPMKRARKT
jgi:hypothetical protein